MTSPVVLFTYNRPVHTKETLEALSLNKLARETDIFIYCDGPKDNDLVKQAKEVLESFKNNFKTFNIIENSENLGLANSIIKGVTEIINRYEKVIVLEDDLVTSPYFLEYMNNALDLYKNDNKVFHINGYWYPIKETLSETFFLSHISSWGWGTWKRAWNHINTDASRLVDLIEKNKEIKRKMNLDNTFNFFSSLKANANGKINTWAIKWQATVLLNNGLSLSPHKTLVKNIGHDGSGTNSGKSKLFSDQLCLDKINVNKQEIEVNTKAWEALKCFYKTIKPNIIRRIINKILR